MGALNSLGYFEPSPHFFRKNPTLVMGDVWAVCPNKAQSSLGVLKYHRLSGVLTNRYSRLAFKLSKEDRGPKIMPPADYLTSADQAQNPHIPRAIGRAWAWRRRMEAGEFATIQELAEAVGLAERHVSRQLRLAYLAPEVLKRLTCGREASAATLQQLIESALLAWQEQEVRVFGEC